MKKINYLSLIILTIVSLSACSSKLVEQVKKEIVIPPGKILFFSKTCPHCTLVRNYITENNITKKLYFVERDINSDQSAYELMPIIAQRCDLSSSKLGVPLFWDGNTCYLGKDEIINYFSTLP